YILIEKLGCTIAPLYVARGARAEDSELNSAQLFVRNIQKRHPDKMLDLEIVEALYPPASLKPGLPKDHKRTKGHPGRNMFLVLVAAYYLRTLKGRNLECSTIFIGNSPNDSFPHSQLLAVRSANIAVCVDQDDWSIQVTSPLFEPY